MRQQRGFTLVEVVVSIALGTLIAAGMGTVLIQSLVIPGESTSELVISQEMRSLTTWIRRDAIKAQSFQLGSTAEDYGTFYWLDFSTYPPTRRSSRYFWEDNTVYRQPVVEGVKEDPIPLINNVLSPSDVTFTLSESTHALNDDATERFLVVTVTASNEPVSADPIEATDTVRVELRPEQLNPAEHLFFFLHNNPSPPVADTVSQKTLTMDATAPTAVTLFNYDTNFDGNPGRQIRRSKKGGELDSTDDREFQDWVSPVFASTVTLDGRASLFISGAGGGSGNLIVLAAWLLDYDPSTGTNTLIVSRALSGIISTSSWTEVGVHFRPTIYTVAPGHRLRLKVQVDGISSNDSSMIAYDTKTHTSLLIVPVQPVGLGIRDFSDIHEGGTTSGSVLDSGGLDVTLVDLLNPAGFRISASGSGGGTATIRVCGLTLLLSDGDSVDVTCGSLIVSVLNGTVQVLSGDSVTIELPESAETTITELTGGSVVVDHSLTTKPQPPVSIQVKTNTGHVKVNIPPSAKARINRIAPGEFAVEQPPDSQGTVTVEAAGVEVALQPGEALPAGPRGVKELALKQLDGHAEESVRIANAIGQIQASLGANRWVDDLHLDPDEGKNVFDEERKAVKELAKLLGKEVEDDGDDDEDDDNGGAQESVSEAALVWASTVIDRLVAADRLLAVTALNESQAATTLDPKNQKNVDKDHADAQEELAEGDADRDAGNPDKAIDHYRKSWEKTQKAIEEQSKPPKEKEKDKDKDDDD